MQGIKSDNIRIQCKDKETGMIGSFAIDNEGNRITPVFDSVIDVFDYLMANGYGHLQF